MRRVGRLVLDRRVDNFFAETEQVAFCTQNIVPGIDFTNDPLLQGRNFSYLDTQLKRLGGPNFTHIPINAPKCPFAHFQQDGHMAMHNPKGRVNYEPNSWTANPGPRESPEKGFRSFPAEEEGPKLRVRSETFADHYSQARQFSSARPTIEQQHIANALDVRAEQGRDAGDPGADGVAPAEHRRGLAEKVAEGLRLREMPKPADAARPTRQDLKPSPALSIVKNGPKSFAGRKVGVLVTDGVDAELLKALAEAVKAEGAMLKLVAPEVGGVEASDGTWYGADEKLEGGPSVLFDAVAILPSEQGPPGWRRSRRPGTSSPTRSPTGSSSPTSRRPCRCFEKAGVADSIDEGFVPLEGGQGLRDVRHRVPQAAVLGPGGGRAVGPFDVSRGPHEPEARAKENLS